MPSRITGKINEHLLFPSYRHNITVNCEAVMNKKANNYKHPLKREKSAANECAADFVN